MMTAEEIAALVDSQVRAIADPEIRSALEALLVPPVSHLRKWEYGDIPPLLCWLVMEDVKSKTGIAYCETGFGPLSPWGLVGLSDRLIGADYSWFTTLEDAFCGSFPAAHLKIWGSAKRLDDGTFEFIEGPMTMYEAFEKRDSQQLDPRIYYPKIIPFDKRK